MIYSSVIQFERRTFCKRNSRIHQSSNTWFAHRRASVYKDLGWKWCVSRQWRFHSTKNALPSPSCFLAWSRSKGPKTIRTSRSCCENSYARKDIDAYGTCLFGNEKDSRYGRRWDMLHHSESHRKWIHGKGLKWHVSLYMLTTCLFSQETRFHFFCKPLHPLRMSNPVFFL